jgi:hypothetical protein
MSGERHPQNMLPDPDGRGTWLSMDPSLPAVPWDIGGMGEDGRYRPGTMLLEDGPPLVELDVLPSQAALGGVAEVVAHNQQTSE